jgi:hypothetical protein
VNKPKKPPVSHKPSYVAQILFECRGVTGDAAHKLQMSVDTVRDYIRRYPACREAREDGIGALLTQAEDNLIEMVYSKDKAATFFVLKTLGKKRWSEQEKETTEKEEDIEFELDDGSTE